MHYNDLREAKKLEEQTHDLSAFEWELEKTPTLHSGFSTATSRDSSTSILQVMFYFSKGKYMARIRDRENHEKAFLEIASLKTAFEEIEVAIVTSKLTWNDDKPFRGNGMAH
ncbi:MAG: hypothetical protein ACYS8I_13570 [Planctomycetota bacterium]|jgi:hypothetical protein